jgi:transcriptional regulator with XRE-family HTH domain
VTNPSIFHARLKEERKRLGLTQAQAAEQCGVKRETWSRYETGALTPGMEVLAALGRAGADMNYILTGDASITKVQPSGHTPGYLVGEPPPADPLARRKAQVKAIVDQLDESGVEAVQEELEKIKRVSDLERRVAELEKKAG